MSDAPDPQRQTIIFGANRSGKTLAGFSQLVEETQDDRR